MEHLIAFCPVMIKRKKKAYSKNMSPQQSSQRKRKAALHLVLFYYGWMDRWIDLPIAEDAGYMV